MTSKESAFMDGEGAPCEPSSPPRPASSWREDPRYGKGGPPRPSLDDTCLRYLQMHAAFEDQRRPGSHAREHIDGCEECRKHFARSEWERKQEQAFLESKEVTDLVAEYARRFRVPVWQRRKFIAAASVFALGALGLGAKAWFGRSRPQPVGNGGSITPRADRMIATANARYDQLYAQGGATAIASTLSGASEIETLRVFRWVAQRQQVSLIPNVVAFLSDSRLRVRRVATSTLRLLPPIPIKPYLTVIRQAAAAETDSRLKAAMGKLVTIVDNA